MSLVPILDSAGEPILDAEGGFIYVWDDDSDICPVPDEDSSAGICVPTGDQ